MRLIAGEPENRALRRSSGVRLAQTARGQAEVAAGRRGQCALAGETALLGDAYQWQRRFAQQPRGTVEAGLEQILVRREGDAVLELDVEVTGAQAGHLGQLGNGDAPRQVVLNMAVQPLQIQRAGRALLRFAE